MRPRDLFRKGRLVRGREPLAPLFFSNIHTIYPPRRFHCVSSDQVGEANQMEAIASDSDYYLSWEYRGKQRIYYSDHFLEITLSDDKTSFLYFMEEDYPLTETGEEDAGKHPRYCLVKYFMDICKWDAVKCATALLEGEACVTADPNQHFPSGMYPLHYAAAEMSYAMVDLLLRHGARTDVETTQVDFFGERCKGGLFPLNVALEKLRTHSYLLDWNWKPYPPLLKMICIFCLPQMKAPLGICRLLASNMSDTDVFKVFNSYCIRGDLIEITALLMFLSKKLIDKSSGSISICKSIAREIEKLTNEEIKLLLNSKSVVSPRKKIMHLKDTLFLLGVFEKIGEAIDSYVKTLDSRTSKEKVVDDIMLLLAAGGVPMKPQDTNLGDIDCEDVNIKLATEMLEEMLQSPNQYQAVESQMHFEDRCHTFVRAQQWAMKGFFLTNNPVLEDGDNKWCKKKHKSSSPKHDTPPPWIELYRPKHDSPPTYSVPVDIMVPYHYHVCARGYASLAWAVKKLPRYI